MGTLQAGSCVLLTHCPCLSPLAFEHFLALWHKLVISYRIILYFPCPSRELILFFSRVIMLQFNEQFICICWFQS